MFRDQLAIHDDIGAGRTDIAVGAVLTRRRPEDLRFDRHGKAVADRHRGGVLREDHHAIVGLGPGRRVGGRPVDETVFQFQPVGLERRLVEEVPKALAELVVLFIRDPQEAILHLECIKGIFSQRVAANLRRPAIERLPVE